jgi:hypothetical protein
VGPVDSSHEVGLYLSAGKTSEQIIGIACYHSSIAGKDRRSFRFSQFDILKFSCEEAHGGISLGSETFEQQIVDPFSKRVYEGEVNVEAYYLDLLGNSLQAAVQQCFPETTFPASPSVKRQRSKARSHKTPTQIKLL